MTLSVKLYSHILIYFFNICLFVKFHFVRQHLNIFKQMSGDINNISRIAFINNVLLDFYVIFATISIRQISSDVFLFSYQTVKCSRTFSPNTVLKIYFLHLFVLQIQWQNGGFWVKPNTFPGFPDSGKCLFILYYQVFRFNTSLIYDLLLLFWSSSSWKAFAFFLQLW